MRRQKGQAVIEFAVVLPLFLLVVFGCIYSGMLFYDYSTLSNLARSGAREAAISESTNYSDIQDHYKSRAVNLTTSLYTPVYTNGYPLLISGTTDSGVEAKITMKLNTASPLMRMVLPDEYTIDYYMKKDN
jgi:Flp pilus assembly protein TadG